MKLFRNPAMSPELKAKMMAGRAAKKASRAAALEKYKSDPAFTAFLQEFGYLKPAKVKKAPKWAYKLPGGPKYRGRRGFASKEDAATYARGRGARMLFKKYQAKKDGSALTRAYLTSSAEGPIIHVGADKGFMSKHSGLIGQRVLVKNPGPGRSGRGLKSKLLPKLSGKNGAIIVGGAAVAHVAAVKGGTMLTFLPGAVTRNLDLVLAGLGAVAVVMGKKDTTKSAGVGLAVGGVYTRIRKSMPSLPGLAGDSSYDLGYDLRSAGLGYDLNRGLGGEYSEDNFSLAGDTANFSIAGL